MAPTSSSGSSSATALAFDFTNGFHDTANAVATSISTRAMSPRVAVAHRRRSLNFVGAFLSLAVAATIATGIVDADVDHAADRLRRADRRDRLEPRDLVLRPAVLVLARADRRRGRRDVRRRRARAPCIGAGLRREGHRPGAGRAGAGVRRRRRWRSSIAYRIVGRQRPGAVTRGFRLGQLVSGSLFSLSHGTNDAQKTMGIIFLALVANGNLQRRPTTSRPGSSSPRPPRSRSAPTSAAGGSSARWAAGSSRWTRRRASPPRARAPR